MQKGSGSLLTGADLARALEWEGGYLADNTKTDAIWRPNSLWANRYKKVGETASGELFANVIRFINESHELILREEKRARTFRNILIGITLFSFACMVTAGWFARESSISEGIAEAAQVKAEGELLWMPLDFTTSIINNQQANGLLKLAKTDDTRKHVFFKKLLTNESLAEHFSHKPDAIIRALVGLDSYKRNELLQMLEAKSSGVEVNDIFRIARVLAQLELGREVSINDILDATADKEGQKTTGDVREILAKKLSENIAKVPEAKVSEVFKIFIDAEMDAIAYDNFSTAENMLIEKAKGAQIESIMDNYITAIVEAKTPDTKKTLGYDLARVAEKVSDSQSAKFVNKLLANMKDPGSSQYFNRGLAALAGKVQNEQVEAIVGTLFTAINETKDPEQRWYLGGVLANIIDKIQKEQASNFIDKFLANIKDPDSSQYFYDGLAALAGKVPDTQTEAIIAAFYSAISDTKAPEQRRNLGRLLGTVVEKVSDAQASKFTGKLLAEMKDPDRGQFFYDGLAALAGKVPDAQTDAMIGTFFTAINDTKDPDKRRYLGELLAGIIGKVKAEQASKFIDKFLANIKDPERSQYFYGGLEALAGNVPSTQTEAILGKLFSAINNDTKDPEQRRYLGGALAKFFGKLQDEQASKLVDTLLANMKDPKNQDNKQYFYDVLAALAVNSQDAQSEKIIGELFDAIKNVKEYYQRENLGKALTIVVDKVPVEKIPKLVDALLVNINDPKNQDIKQYFYGGLAALAEKVQDSQSDMILEGLIDAMKDNNDYNQRESLGKALAAVVDKVPIAQLSKLVDTLIADMKDPKNQDKKQFFYASLVAAAKSSPEQATIIADNLIETIKDASVNQPFEAFGDGLKKVVQKIPERQAGEMANHRLIDSMKNLIEQSSVSELTKKLKSKNLSEDEEKMIRKQLLAIANGNSPSNQQLEALSQGLLGLVPKLTESEADSLAQSLVETIQKNTDSNQLEMLSRSIAAVSARLKPDNAGKILFQLLKNPLTPRDILAEAIRGKFPGDAPKEDQGYWSLIEWGTKKQLIL
ncbi:MAG: hypothetical protein IPN42_00060 [Methylococcaceae bacterium]|nr:hypothetical protein [Methylococcaceae bacterium]